MNPNNKPIAYSTGGVAGGITAASADNDIVQIIGVIVSALSIILPIIERLLAKRRAPVNEAPEEDLEAVARRAREKFSRSNDGAAHLTLVFIIGCLSFFIFTGASCPRNKPPAPGQDGAVIHTERAQELSLEAFKQLTEWELAHRAALPAEVSHAVDDVRREFPPLWFASVNVLADYKAARPPDATRLQQVTAALTAAQKAMIALKVGGDAAPIAGVTGALLQLADSLEQF